MSDATRPLVSVVMPVYDVAPFLAEAIESVRAQTYPRWELLLCEDGSTDGSDEIARRYVALDPERIHYLEHEGRANRGASATRNAGLRAARGGIVALLDGDDVWMPTKLEEQVAILESRPDADVVYGPGEYWYSWADATRASEDRVQGGGLPTNTLLARRELLTRMLRREIHPPWTCCIAIRAEAVRRSGGFVNEFRTTYTDQVFFARLSLEATALYVDRCWARYRIHPASASSQVQRAGGKRDARLRFLTWLEGYLPTTAARDDLALRVALRAALRRVRHPRLFAVVDGARALLRRLLGRGKTAASQSSAAESSSAS